MSFWRKLFGSKSDPRAEYERLQKEIAGEIASGIIASITNAKCPQCGGQMTLNLVNLVENTQRIALDNGKVPQLINCPLWTCGKCSHTRQEPPVTRAPRPITIDLSKVQK